MAQKVFNNTVIEGHHAFKCFGSTLQAVSEGIYKKRYRFNEKIKCIDGDKLVGNKNSSVDAIIGISDYTLDKFVNDRLLLIELRMDYVTKEDLRKSKHTKKVSGTLSCLGRDIRIDKKSYFIFDKGFIQKANRIFSNWRKEGGDARYFYAFSVEEFYLEIADIEEVSKQYIVRYPTDKLEAELTTMIMYREWNQIINKMYDLKKEIEKFYNTYKLREIKPIIQAYQNVWPKLKERGPFDDDIEIEMELIEYYYNSLCKKF